MDDFGEFNKRLRSLSIQELKQMLASAGMPTDVKKLADTALEAMEALVTVSPGDSKHLTALGYIGYLASLPWKKSAANKPDLQGVETILNKHVHDQGSRRKILEHLSGMFKDDYKKPRILVVDDERIALESLTYILEREDYTVVTARSGAEAIDKLKTSDIDLVITDLIMGEIDGTAIIQETISKYPGTRVIMITGYATVDTAVQALRMGAFHYIEKPVRVDDLLSSVKDALRQKYSNGKRNVLCFEGPSREAHISLGKMIAIALDRKFINMSLSEMKVESEVIGLGRTAEDARPGRIIDEIRLAGAADPLFMLEGLDTAAGDFSGDFSSVLMEALSPLRNRNFTDRYLDVPFDLSGVIFIVTAEDAENIQSPLRDILEVVKL
ncbi:MAG: response regulator [Nitrospirae bacterium]|nr:response regulator [Nitrospirota bacterium]